VHSPFLRENNINVRVERGGQSREITEYFSFVLARVSMAVKIPAKDTSMPFTA